MPSVTFPCKIFTITHPIKNVANIPRIANHVQKIKLKNLSIVPPEFNKKFYGRMGIKAHSFHILLLCSRIQKVPRLS